MSLTAKRFDPIRRQLAAYEESWKADHDAALRRCDVEDLVAVGLATVQLLQRIEDAWRDRVFRGSAGFTTEDDAGGREGWRLWLLTAPAKLQEKPPFEHRFRHVAEAHDLEP